MILFISVILFALGLCKKRSRSLYFMQFCWMWIVLALCNDYYRVDYQNYIKMYIRHGEAPIEFSNTEVGFKLLNKLFYSWGFSFESTNMIYVGIMLIAIAYIIPKYTKHYNCVASLFMLFPLLLNGIQIRNAFSSVVLIWGIRYLFEAQKGNMRKYVISVCVAMMFHVTALFYLIFVFARINNKEKLLLVSSFFAVVSTFVLDFFSPILSKLAGEKRYNSKLINSNTMIECAVAALWILLMVAVINYIYKDVCAFSKDERKREFCRVLLNLNILSISLIPLFSIDFSFERLFRNFSIYNYCIFSSYLYNEISITKTKKRWICVSGVVLWLAYSSIVFQGILGDRIYGVVIMYLTNNIMFVKPREFLVLVLFMAIITGVLFIMDIKNLTLKTKRVVIEKT